mgnify:CR=1 FL=1
MNGATIITTPRCILAAMRGGQGKTAVSVGVTRALIRQGRKVASFKKGPDYIDAAWLTRSAKSPCYNLDTFLLGDDPVLDSFVKHARHADMAVIEGARGLFDGMDQQGSYSTAALAALIQAPVVLVVDCSKITRTAAALVLGCMTFDPEVTISGVILNQVARARHEDMLRASIQDRCGVPVIGAMPRLKDFPFQERHLGLIPPQEHLTVDQAVDQLADAVENHIDLDALWALSAGAPELRSSGRPGMSRLPMPHQRPRIGVIRDSAFQFYYPENLEALKEQGADLVDISALTDRFLPDIDALYIGGGFPETHAAQLAGNETFRIALRQAVEDGLPVYAECGGAMYMGNTLVCDGREYPMVGALPITYGLSRRPRGHGYTVCRVDRANPFFEQAQTLRGHEFHYSYVLEWDQDAMTMAFTLERGYGFDGAHDGACRHNVLAAYSHMHAAGEHGWAAGLIRSAIRYMGRKPPTPRVSLENGGKSLENQLKSVYKKVVGKT